MIKNLAKTTSKYSCPENYREREVSPDCTVKDAYLLMKAGFSVSALGVPQKGRCPLIKVYTSNYRGLHVIILLSESKRKAPQTLDLKPYILGSIRETP